MADIDRDQTDIELDVLFIQAFNIMAATLQGQWKGGPTALEALELLDRRMLTVGWHKVAAARQRWGFDSLRLKGDGIAAE